MVINKKAVKKKKKNFVFYKLYVFSLKFVGIVFVSSLFDLL